MFWLVSAAVLLLAAWLTLGPLLAADFRWRAAAVAGLILLPLAGYLLYPLVGTPAALDASARAQTQVQAPAGSMEELTEQLRKRLQDNPDEVEGWVLLGKSYKTLRKYPQAQQALETANRLQPNQPLIVVELVEARLFASGDPRITPEMSRQLEQAVASDPGLQKGLWLLGIAAAQSGNDQQAIEWWQRLMEQLDPAGPVAQNVRTQIEQAQVRLGGATEPPPASPAPQIPANGAGWNSPPIEVVLDARASAALPATPPGSVLFVIVRAANQAAGPPLGVRRFDQPVFPVQLSVSDANSMMPQRPISASRELNLQARLSLSGQPTPSPGDWQSEAQTLSVEDTDAVTLVLNQKVE